MQTHDLIPHPAYPPHAVRAVRATVDNRDPYWLRLRWRMEGAAQIVVPAPAGRARQDGLWRTTCFELFARRVGGTAYQEWNFSPSQAWAAYAFSAYRGGMAELPVARAPMATWRGGASGLRLMDVAVSRTELPSTPFEYSLTAVIEEQGGRMSYWAAMHPDGPPDFHDPACFAAVLAAPNAL